MKKKINFILWNVCDYVTASNPKLFMLCAYINHLLGCDYWYKSKDYNQ